MADESRKTALIAQLDAQRAQLATSAAGVRTHANFGARIKASMRTHLLAWVGGAILLGVLLAPRRPRKVLVDRKTREKVQTNTVRAGVGLAVLKFAFDFARPALVSWAGPRLAEWIARRAGAARRDRR
jgi:hypothetical protein